MPNQQKILLTSLFLLGIIPLLIILFGDRDLIQSLTKEDGPAENLTALFYLVGSVLCAISIHKSEYKTLPILWALLCFIFLGEETSWFQRIFNYSVTSVEAMSTQNEFNLHNLEVFHTGSLLGSPSLKTF
jgi:hypothetical protein